MTPHIAKNALQLIQRAQLYGTEVPVYLQVMSALEAIADPKITPLPTQAATQTEFDAAVDARDMPSGATRQPDPYSGD